MYFAFSLGKERKRRQHRAKKSGHKHFNSENRISCIFREITEDRHSVMSRRNRESICPSMAAREMRQIANGTNAQKSLAHREKQDERRLQERPASSL